jgi:hypothetical protein
MNERQITDLKGKRLENPEWFGFEYGPCGEVHGPDG